MRNGRREINELHVPLGRPVDLIMASQDVIHSFYVPAFRLKQDVLPGRYTHLWFTATRLGEFHLFCAEYCGTEHAGMVGKVMVLAPGDYARWLDAGPAEPGMAQQGFALFRSTGCSGCHDAGSTVHAPLLQGLYGRTVQLQDGRHVVADEHYLRDSIVLPGSDVAAGFAPLMPSFAGQFDEDAVASSSWRTCGRARPPTRRQRTSDDAPATSPPDSRCARGSPRTTTSASPSSMRSRSRSSFSSAARPRR